MNRIFARLSLTGLMILMLMVVLTGTVSAAPSVTGLKAGSGQAITFKIHDEGADAIDDFCSTSGLTVEHTYSLDIFVHIVPRGVDQLEYYLQHGVWTDTYTSNGKTVTSIANVTEKDQFITDNGDGTFTIVILATGNATAYSSDGKAIARNPGQLRFVVTVEADGSLTFGEVVKDSTGRNDSFCDAATAELTK